MRVSSNELGTWSGTIVVLAGAVEEWVRRRVRRKVREIRDHYDKRIRAVEELASDAYHEAAIARQALVEMTRRGGKRWSDPPIRG